MRTQTTFGTGDLADDCAALQRRRRANVAKRAPVVPITMTVSRAERCWLEMRRQGFRATQMARLMDPPVDNQLVSRVLRPAKWKQPGHVGRLSEMRVLVQIERILGVAE